MNTYDQIRQLAFSLDPPNQITPQLVQLANEAQAEAERLEGERDEAGALLASAMEQHKWLQHDAEKFWAERDEARAEVDLWFKRSQEHATEAERSRAQVKELAEALDDAAGELEGISEMHSDDRADYNDAARWASEKARAALSRLASADQRTGDTSSQ